MQRFLGMTLMVLGLCAAAMATVGRVPEIDPASVTSAVALLSGTVLVIRARKK